MNTPIDKTPESICESALSGLEHISAKMLECLDLIMADNAINSQSIANLRQFQIIYSTLIDVILEQCKKDMIARARYEERFMRIYREVQVRHIAISSALHEASHVVVAHILELNVKAANIVHAHRRSGATTIGDYEDQDQGEAAMNARKFAVALYAGRHGESLVAPWYYSMGDESDLDNASLRLEKIGLNTETEKELLNRLSADLIKISLEAVYAIARYLLREKTISNEMIFLICTSQLADRIEECRTIVNDVLKASPLAPKIP